MLFQIGLGTPSVYIDTHNLVNHLLSFNFKVLHQTRPQFINRRLGITNNQPIVNMNLDEDLDFLPAVDIKRRFHLGCFKTKFTQYVFEM
jgi:hypothetical protein